MLQRSYQVSCRANVTTLAFVRAKLTDYPCFFPPLHAFRRYMLRQPVVFTRLRQHAGKGGDAIDCCCTIASISQASKEHPISTTTTHSYTRLTLSTTSLTHHLLVPPRLRCQVLAPEASLDGMLDFPQFVGLMKGVYDDSGRVAGQPSLFRTQAQALQKVRVTGYLG